MPNTLIATRAGWIADPAPVIEAVQSALRSQGRARPEIVRGHEFINARLKLVTCAIALRGQRGVETASGVVRACDKYRTVRLPS